MPIGPSANEPSSHSRQAPTLDSALSNRRSEGACVSVARAISSACLGPWASRSGMPSSAATLSACAIAPPLMRLTRSATACGWRRSGASSIAAHVATEAPIHFGSRWLLIITLRQRSASFFKKKPVSAGDMAIGVMDVFLYQAATSASAPHRQWLARFRRQWPQASGARHKGKPAVRIEAWVEFRDCRHFWKLRNTFQAGDRQGLQSSAAYQRQAVREIVERDIDASCQKIHHRRPHALIGNVREADARVRLQHFAGQMRRTADARRCKIEFAGFRLCIRNQLVEVRSRHVRIGNKQQRLLRENRDGHKCAGIEAEFRKEALADDQRPLRRCKQRVPIGRGLGDEFSAEILCSSRLILDNDGLAPSRRQFFSNDSGQCIRGWAWRQRNNDFYCVIRVTTVR